MRELFEIYYAWVRMVFVLPVIALGLVACQTTNPSTTPPAASSSWDDKVAAATKKLAEYCTVAQVGIATAKTGELFVKDAKVRDQVDQALAVIEPTVNNFCLNTPSDVQSAVTQMAQLVLTINTVVAKAKGGTSG